MQEKPTATSKAYREMSREEARELEALEWAEATIGDVADENVEVLRASNLCFPASAVPSAASASLREIFCGRRKSHAEARRSQ